jgi:hypothetical protein
MKPGRRKGHPLNIVADMDLMAAGLIRTAKQDKCEGSEVITLGSRLRIFDAVTKWVVAKNRLDNIDERSGIDALKARLRGGAASQGDDDSGTDRTSGRASRVARFTPDRTKGGPEFNRLKRKLPDNNNRHPNGRRRDDGNAHSVVVGSDGGLDSGIPDHPEQSDDNEADDERHI